MRYGKSSVCSCGTGALAAHETSRLMLLGSPPDMVRGHPLRETGSAAACGGLFIAYLFYYTIAKLSTKIFAFLKKLLFTRENFIGIISFAAGKLVANGGVAQLGGDPVRF